MITFALVETNNLKYAWSRSDLHYRYAYMHMDRCMGENVAMKNFRILVVDDDPDITLTFKTGLEQNGFTVDTFNDPLDAISSFMAGVYDLVLLDIKMPRMNGFELHNELKMIDNKLRACFITSFVAYYQSLKEMFSTPEISCFIKKPIEMNDLIKKIKSELE